MRMKWGTDMSANMLRGMVIAYLVIFGGLYLLFRVTNHIGDSREVKEVDWDKEDEWYWSIK